MAQLRSIHLLVPQDSIQRRYARALVSGCTTRPVLLPFATRLQYCVPRQAGLPLGREGVGVSSPDGQDEAETDSGRPDPDVPAGSMREYPPRIFRHENVRASQPAALMSSIQHMASVVVAVQGRVLSDEEREALEQLIAALDQLLA